MAQFFACSLIVVYEFCFLPCGVLWGNLINVLISTETFCLFCATSSE